MTEASFGARPIGNRQEVRLGHANVFALVAELIGAIHVLVEDRSSDGSERGVSHPRAVVAVVDFALLGGTYLASARSF